MPAQFRFHALEAFSTGVGKHRIAECIDRMDDEISEVERERSDFPLELPAERVPTQSRLEAVRLLGRQDRDVDVRPEVDRRRLERTTVVDEESSVLARCAIAPQPDRDAARAAETRRGARVGAGEARRRIERIDVAEVLLLLRVVEAHAGEDCDCIRRGPVELRIEAAEIAGVAQSIHFINVVGGGAGGHAATIKRRYVGEVVALLRATAVEPVDTGR